MTNQEMADGATLLDELRQARYVALASYSHYFTDSASRTAVKGLLDASGKRIDKLGDDLQKSTTSFASWLSRAHVEQGIYSGKGNVFEIMDGSSYSFGRLWDEVIAQSAKDTVVLAKDTAEAAQDSLPWVTIGLVAVAAIVIFK